MLRYFSLIAIIFMCATAQADPLLKKYGAMDTEAPVNFTAKSLSHDDDNQTVTAIGDVEFMQGKQILRADKVIYYLAEDRVEASGNVSLLDEMGNLHFADQAELHDKMKDGYVKGLLSVLADGSRFTSSETRREDNGNRIVMKDATYTSCKVCEEDPEPLWQIKAEKVVHNAEEKEITYKNARLEMLGVPVIWTPTFSHPDPTVKRKSGFLRPEYGWSATRGTHLRGGYYYDIAPDRDATFWLAPSAKAGTLAEGEWRERFERGMLKLNVSGVESDRREEDGRVEENRARGHIFAEGRYDIDDQWRAGFDVQRASDKQYLRFYDISHENVLSNQVYAERFADRDYSRVSAFNFQDVRLGARPEQPDILPMAEHDMVGDPNSLWGGRWEFGLSTLGLQRGGSDQSVNRASVQTGWERRGISAQGFENVVRLDARGDFYDVHDSDAAKLNPALPTDPAIARGMTTASFISSYPLAKRFEQGHALIEPVAGVSVSPRVNGANKEVPNEDSIDIRFDTNNLFEENRYPGVDRQEDGGRFNYGLKTGYYADDGRYGTVYIGQSYRFYGDKIFPTGSGLEERHSDVVGQVKAGLGKYFDGAYRFQFDSETLAAKRHEVQAGGGNDDFRVNTRYLYTSKVAGTGFNEAREQFQSDGTLRLNERWSVSASALMDLGDQPGLRNASTGLTYADECFTLGLEGTRNVANVASGENESRVMVRIGLKNIGEFSPTGGGEKQ